MLEITKTNEELTEYIDSFIWDFKIRDNLLYNIEILFSLIKDHGGSKIYNKPISILTIAIIEAIMADFLYRLHGATNHFPSNAVISPEIKIKIKDRLKKETTKKEMVVNGEKHTYSRLNNFGFKTMIEIYTEYKLFGKNNEKYKLLMSLSRFRNRVHILNYFGNFEKDETRVFSTYRTQETLDVMIWMIKYFNKNYARPW
jgi:hypothetical protein